MALTFTIYFLKMAYCLFYSVHILVDKNNL